MSTRIAGIRGRDNEKAKKLSRSLLGLKMRRREYSWLFFVLFGSPANFQFPHVATLKRIKRWGYEDAEAPRSFFSYEIK